MVWSGTAYGDLTCLQKVSEEVVTEKSYKNRFFYRIIVVARAEHARQNFTFKDSIPCL